MIEHERNKLTTVIQETLRSFGYGKRYRGYKQVCYCLYLAVVDCSRLNSVTHEIYERCATHFDCDWKTVERNLRMASSRAWKINPDLLSEIANRRYAHPPIPSELLKIISSYIVFSNPDIVTEGTALLW